MPKLNFMSGDLEGKVYALTLEKTTVGRSHTNALVVPNSFVSARHCEILVNGAEVIVRDLGSRNGTFVNGRRLQNQQCGVKSGHIVSFASVQARVEIELELDETDWSNKSAVYSHARVMRDVHRARRESASADGSIRREPAELRAGNETMTELDTTRPQFVLTPIDQNSSPQRRASPKAVFWIMVAASASLLLWLIALTWRE